MAELFDRFKVARLRNRLVNLGNDIETNNVLNARFKKLVSGEPQIAEMKHRDPFEFQPYAKLLFSANEFIPSRDRSYGFFEGSKSSVLNGFLKNQNKTKISKKPCIMIFLASLIGHY